MDGQSLKNSIPPDCLACNCTAATGCRREKKEKRTYVMKRPRGRRGPYKIVKKGREGEDG